jgi:hypothetical protein
MRKWPAFAALAVENRYRNLYRLDFEKAFAGVHDEQIPNSGFFRLGLIALRLPVALHLLP